MPASAPDLSPGLAITPGGHDDGHGQNIQACEMRVQHSLHELLFGLALYHHEEADHGRPPMTFLS